MNVNFEFKPQQLVFALIENKIQEFYVKGCYATWTSNEDSPEVEYTLGESFHNATSRWPNIPENRIAKDKQTLLTKL